MRNIKANFEGRKDERPKTPRPRVLPKGWINELPESETDLLKILERELVPDDMQRIRNLYKNKLRRKQ